MQAEVGDRLVISSHYQGEPIRDGEIIGVGQDGGPPFLVRWSDDGHESLYVPGSDAWVEHFPRGSAKGHPSKAATRSAS